MMISRPQEFVLDADVDEDPLARVLAALGQAFTVTEERGAAGSGIRRRTWLDTFDWRLYNAGLILEHEQTRPAGRLILTRQDGSPLAEQPVPGWQPRRPVLPADLPPGVLKDAIAALLEPRAILPAAQAVTARTVLRLLNADGKTVARLLVERTTAVGMGTNPVANGAKRAAIGVAVTPIGTPVFAVGEAEELPLRLSIAEVRGYSGHARRAASRLAAVPGARPVGTSVFVAALAGLGCRPGDYTGNAAGAQVTGDMPGAVAVATVLLSMLDTIERNVDGVLHDTDTEFLHDLRVAVRRTRSAIKLLGDVFPAELTGHYRAEFKWLGDMTTPVRDLDVHLLGFGDLAAGLRAGTPADLEPFRDFLIRRRVTEFRRLSSVLRSARFRALTHDWRKALCETLDTRGSHARPGTRGRPRRRQQLAAALATDRTARAYRDITRRGGAITPQSPSESLHDLRKRCKELRYLLEFFAPLYEPEAYRKVTGDLKKLQDCLGEFQDSQVQREEIARLAEVMLTERTATHSTRPSAARPSTAGPSAARPSAAAGNHIPAATFLAMGEISGRLALRQDEARADFGRRFAAFAGAVGQERVRALLEGTG